MTLQEELVALLKISRANRIGKAVTKYYFRMLRSAVATCEQELQMASRKSRQQADPKWLQFAYSTLYDYVRFTRETISWQQLLLAFSWLSLLRHTAATVDEKFLTCLRRSLKYHGLNSIPSPDA